MGPKKNKKGKKSGGIGIEVSVCTPTFNRRPFIPMLIKMYLNQDYPQEKMEWVIIDDGTDPIEDLVTEANIKNLKLIPRENSIGQNFTYYNPNQVIRKQFNKK